MDADFIKNINPHIPIQVFANGNLVPEPNDRQQYWKDKFNNNVANWIFVGSQHDPNITGLEILTNELRKLKTKGLILWIFGGAGLGLVERLCINGTSLPNFVKIVGLTDQSNIDAAILESSGIVLPITYGGGSNLKTAQALLSNKCVLGTAHSFRSFETYTNEPGVFICNTIGELALMMIKEKPEEKYIRSDSLSNLHWDSILDGLTKFVDRTINHDLNSSELK
jgi:hypothetical protein